ncbi:MAG TPA: MFS transporter [Gemmatimonadales bacterium]
MHLPLDRRRILAWCLFDFANSAYSAVIVATVFGIYYASTIVGNAEGRGDLWWGRAISLSMIGVVLTGPVLGAIADRAGLRKRFFIAFTVLCIACVALFTTLAPGMILWGFALAALANFAFESAQIYYNAYLPDIAPPARRGSVSGLGFGVGYLGSIIALLIAVPLAAAHRLDLIWLSIAGFFAVFSIPAFVALPADRPRVTPFQFRQIARDVLAHEELRRFLLAFFVYFDGVETTIYFSGIFAAHTLGFTTPEVIKLFLAVQASALAGALLLARPTDRWGPKRVITLTLLLWIGVSLGAYFAPTKTAFFAVAVIAGLGLGPIQAASRALMASLIPPGKEAELFGVYAMVGKSSAILGPLVFGTVSHALHGNQRAAVLAVGVFFAIGLALLQRVRAKA